LFSFAAGDVGIHIVIFLILLHFDVDSGYVLMMDRGLLVSDFVLGIPSLLVVHSRDTYGNIDANIADDSSKVISLLLEFFQSRRCDGFTNATDDSHWMVFPSKFLPHPSDNGGRFINRNSNHHRQWHLSTDCFVTIIAWQFDRNSLFRLIF
jgi:hypothetical protein